MKTVNNRKIKMSQKDKEVGRGCQKKETHLARRDTASSQEIEIVASRRVLFAHTFCGIDNVDYLALSRCSPVQTDRG